MNNISNQNNRWLKRIAIDHKFIGHFLFIIATIIFVICLTQLLSQHPFTLNQNVQKQNVNIGTIQNHIVEDDLTLLNKKTTNAMYHQDDLFQKTNLKPRISVATFQINEDSDNIEKISEQKASDKLNQSINSSGGLGGYNGVLIALIYNQNDDTYYTTIAVRPFMRSILTDQYIQSLIDQYKYLAKSTNLDQQNQYVNIIRQKLVQQINTHYLHQTKQDRKNYDHLTQALWFSGIYMFLWLLLNCLAMTDLTVDGYGKLMYNPKHPTIDDSELFATGAIIGALTAEQVIHHSSDSSGGGGFFDGGGGGGFSGGGGDFFSGGDGGGFG